MSPSFPHAFSAVVFSMVLSGCATTYRNTLPKSVAGQLHDVDLTTAVDRDRISKPFGYSNEPALVGGLAGFAAMTVANAYLNNTHDEALNELSRIARSYNLGQFVADSLVARMNTTSALPLASVRIVEATRADLASLASQGSGECVMIVFANQFMDRDCRHIIVQSEVYVCARAPGLRKVAVEQNEGRVTVPVLFRNDLQTVHEFPAGLLPTVATRDTLLRAWSANNGAVLKGTIENACAELADMVRWDLSQSPAQSAGSSSGQKVAVVCYEPLGARSLDGTIVNSVGNRVWARTPSGRLYSQLR